jgi:hypothetical protein
MSDKTPLKKPMKPWKCKHGHILGYIRWNGNDLPQLMVLRESMDMDAERPDEADVLGPVDGQMSIRCKICDEVTVWKISVESLLAIFAQLDDAKVFEFSRRLLEMNRKSSGQLSVNSEVQNEFNK